MLKDKINCFYYVTIAQTKGIVSLAEANEISSGPKVIRLP